MVNSQPLVSLRRPLWYTQPALGNNHEYALLLDEDTGGPLGSLRAYATL